MESARENRGMATEEAQLRNFWPFKLENGKPHVIFGHYQEEAHVQIFTLCP